jgi:hypothetical protein
MMANSLFIAGISIFFFLVFCWGFRHLPEERWQIMACVPVSKNGSDTWKGMNLTYYGFFNALAYGIGTSLLFVLLASAGIPFAGALIMIFAILAICVPASSLVARLIEKKSFTFSVGGASFIGILIMPWVILLTDRIARLIMGFSVPLYPALAAVSIAYAIGEGTGRLACISYGCCYGKPLSETGPVLRRIFNRHHFIFTGKTKKISYASKLDGVEVIPIQAVTSTVYSVIAIAGIFLYLKGYFLLSFFIPFAVTQIWRVLSEFMRADYRGEGFVSAYQIMAVISICYISIIVFFLPCREHISVDIAKGLLSLWNPAVIITVEAVFIITFLYTGRSNMTASSVTLHVNDEFI